MYEEIDTVSREAVMFSADIVRYSVGDESMDEEEGPDVIDVGDVDLLQRIETERRRLFIIHVTYRVFWKSPSKRYG